MLTLETRVRLDGVTGQGVSDFLLGCDDARYQAWWPGTHRQFHVVRPGGAQGHLGDIVRIDEQVGVRRLRVGAKVVSVVPAEAITWRMRAFGVPLPARLSVQLRTDDNGVDLRHTLLVGWRGPGRVLDPFWRLYVTRRFARDLDRHARTEFALLAQLLRHDHDPDEPGGRR